MIYTYENVTKENRDRTASIKKQITETKQKLESIE